MSKPVSVPWSNAKTWNVRQKAGHLRKQGMSSNTAHLGSDTYINRAMARPRRFEQNCVTLLLLLRCYSVVFCVLCVCCVVASGVL